ncbi:protein FAM98B [Synchiropus splendidus]|uniref:protein FAM98B n=1 Tax=Synchiropus splendidus TaxID=270530 RepID=UPI00237E5DF6|nr:protein FAM98B [Synchiropus splendidus]
MECDILDSLEQLGYDGGLTEEQCLRKAAEEGLSSPEYVGLCHWLVSRLKPLCELEENITSGPEDLDSLRVELSGFLKELHCPCDVSRLLNGGKNTKDHLKILLFMTSELQAAQILKSRPSSEQEQSSEGLELRQICETLQLGSPAGQDGGDVISRIQNKVQETLKSHPKCSVGNPVLKKPLSHEQWEKLHKINTVLSSEYECRRRMLIKRLDVTIQSFGWSDRAKVRLDSMAKVYQPRRHSMRPQTTVGLAHLLAAREDICNVVKTSSGASREKTTCAVNKVQMGRVPDRGGRPSEIQAPPPEMPPWQKRQDGGGGWGGRGGRGGGGGGWGRGGGGWRGGGGGGGWGRGQHHGGKRGRYQY